MLSNIEIPAERLIPAVSTFSPKILQISKQFKVDILPSSALINMLNILSNIIIKDSCPEATPPKVFNGSPFFLTLS